MINQPKVNDIIAFHPDPTKRSTRYLMDTRWIVTFVNDLIAPYPIHLIKMGEHGKPLKPGPRTRHTLTARQYSMMVNKGEILID